MGQITVQTIVDKVRADLVDADAVTWTDADLIEDMNEGIRALCTVKTDAYVLSEFVPLVAGIRQTLPEGSVALFGIDENEVSGRRVTPVDRELLDETAAFWPAGQQSTDVIHYCADPRNKVQFVVYPPNDGDGSVRVTRGALPDPVLISGISGAWPINDQYEPAIVQYMFGAAYRRNTQRQDLAKTSDSMQKFFTMVGLSAQAQAAVAPKVTRSEGL